MKINEDSLNVGLNASETKRNVMIAISQEGPLLAKGPSGYAPAELNPLLSD